MILNLMAGFMFICSLVAIPAIIEVPNEHNDLQCSMLLPFS